MGFTLIETIVVVAVIGLTLPVLITTIFILVRQQTKVFRLSQVKREGDYLINVMENTIKDRAITIHSAIPTDDNIVCDSPLNPHPSTAELYFIDKDKRWFGYLFDGVSSIASYSADLSNPSINLASTKIIVNSFSISCARNTIYSPPSVSLDFDVCYNAGSGVCASIRPEEIASIHYQTRIKLRNY